MRSGTAIHRHTRPIVPGPLGRPGAKRCVLPVLAALVLVLAALPSAHATSSPRQAPFRLGNPKPAKTVRPKPSYKIHPSRVNDLRNDAFSRAHIVRDLVFDGDISSALQASARLAHLKQLDMPTAPPGRIAGAVPAAIAEPIGRLVAAVTKATSAVRVSSTLRDASQASLRTPLWGSSLLRKAWSLASERAPDDESLADLQRRQKQFSGGVKRQRVYDAAFMLADTIDQTLPALEAYGQSFPAGTSSATGCDVVDLTPVLCVGGNGTNTYTVDQSLLIDLGGDDAYYNSAGGAQPSGNGLWVSVNVDVAGNDVYRTPVPTPSGAYVAQGAGLGIRGADGAIGILVDVAGSDVYEASIKQEEAPTELGSAAVAQGSAWGKGVGILADLDGEDSYRVTADVEAIYVFLNTHGMGYVGAGVLLDAGGDDDVYLSAANPRVVTDEGVVQPYGFVAANAFGGGAVNGVGIFADDGGADQVTVEARPEAIAPDDPRPYRFLRLFNDSGVGTGGLGAGVLGGAGVALTGNGPTKWTSRAAESTPENAYVSAFGFGGGAIGGYGAVSDGGGNDTYVVEAIQRIGHHATVNDASPHSVAKAQAYTMGRASVAGNGWGGLGGVGVQEDLSGDDRYLMDALSAADARAFNARTAASTPAQGTTRAAAAIALSAFTSAHSQGIGLFGGAGFLHDSGGNDVYHNRAESSAYASARATTPGAEVRASAVAGLTESFTQAHGFLGGYGELADSGGSDVYRSAAQSSASADPPGGTACSVGAISLPQAAVDIVSSARFFDGADGGDLDDFSSTPARPAHAGIRGRGMWIDRGQYYSEGGTLPHSPGVGIGVNQGTEGLPLPNENLLPPPRLPNVERSSCEFPRDEAEIVPPSPTPTATPSSSSATTSSGDYPLVPSDSYFSDQWSIDVIGASAAWQEPEATGSGIKVAIIDSGIDLEHEDLQCRGKLELDPEADIVKDGDGAVDVLGYGTYVAGIVGACTNNGVGIAGVAPDAILLPYQVFADDDASFEDVTDDIALAVKAASAAGAHVIALPGASLTNATEGSSESLQRLAGAIADASSSGSLVVAPAGDGTHPFCQAPAIAEHVLCVGATDRRDAKAWYASLANKHSDPRDIAGGATSLAVVAPGGVGTEVPGWTFCGLDHENVLSLWPADLDECGEGRRGYFDRSGTWVATAHVAGIAALVYDRLGGDPMPAARNSVLDAIVSTADDLGVPDYDPIFGYGRVNALSAVQKVDAVADDDPGTTATPTSSPTSNPTVAPTSGSPDATPTTSPDSSACTTLFTSPSGDAPNDAPAGDGNNLDNLDLISGSIPSSSGADFIARIQAKDLQPSVPPNATSVNWYFQWYYNGTDYWAGAEITKGDTTAKYRVGTYSGGYYATRASTTGTFNAGANGTIEINVPVDKVGAPGSGNALERTFATTYTGAGAGGAGFVFPIDRSPKDDDSYGRDYILGERCDGTGTPSPLPPESPGSSTRGAYPAVPSDEYFARQWGPQKIEAPAAWQLERATGFGIEVAVLDTGIDLQHEDLQCAGKLNILSESDVVASDDDPDDQNGHGTHVAGIIGACTNNGRGIGGIAPDATLIPVRVLNQSGEGSTDWLISGINAAVEAGAHVINLSLGSGPVSSIDGFVSSDLVRAVRTAASAGVVIVAAAGNDSFPLCAYPAAAEEVICTGATDKRDLKAWYSSFPNKTRGGPALVAPGGNEVVFCNIDSESILSLYPREKDGCDDGKHGYRNLNGTSMATPHVAGVAALVYDRLRGVRSPENAQKVIRALTSTVVDLGPPGYDPVYGSGRINALAAVRSIPDPDASENPSEDPSESPAEDPSESPSEDPSETPTSDPTQSPTDEPTSDPGPTTPEAPSNLTARAASSSRIELAWADNSDGESGFTIERSFDGEVWEEIATAGRNVTAYLDMGLQPDTSYFYRVRAMNASGYSPYSNTASATTMRAQSGGGGNHQPPAAPTNLAATSSSSSRIDVSWTDSSNNEDGFALERSRGASSRWQEIATIGRNHVGYLDTGLTADTSYSYRVRAYNFAGHSAYSNVASAKTGTAAGSDEPSPELSKSAEPVEPVTMGTATTSITASRLLTSYQESFELSGEIQRDDNCTGPLEVEVSRRIHGTNSYAVAASTPVNGAGQWGLQVIGQRNASYVAQVKKTDTCQGDASVPTDVLVRAKIELERPRCSNRAKITGQVLPDHDSTIVRLQRRRATRWRTVDTDELDRGSGFTLQARSCRGRYRVIWPRQGVTNLRGMRAVRW